MTAEPILEFITARAISLNAEQPTNADHASEQIGALKELTLMCDWIANQKRLESLAQPQAQTRLEKLVEMDGRLDNPEIVFKGKKPI